MYNREYAESFRYGLMFGKDIKPGDRPFTSVIDEGDVLLAVRKAYIDMSPRTFDSIDNNKQVLDNDSKEKLFVQLSDKIVHYMKNGAVNFDVWHTEICKFFIGEFRLILRDSNRPPELATYGKAQKIINMTFKYLYCYDDAAVYFERFVPCHMALDRYILEWFYSWYKNKWNDEYPDKKLTVSGKYRLPVWSSLKYKKDEGDIIPQYSEIQQAIQERLAEVPRIEAEFLIWYEVRTRREFYTF